MNKISIQNFKTPFGELTTGSFRGQICLCDWRYRKMRASIDRRILNGLDAYFREEKTDAIRLAGNQLNEYLEGNRTEFDIPLLPVGTPFQKRVWEELLRIPYGNTESYLGISRKIKNDKSIRAVAAASGANAISIFIPCHRVIGNNGEMTGYAGGIETKKKLLDLESGKSKPEQMELFI
jgi:methylated-DNA-[protein]-cysteine S-methyltransferase